jgi:hypothetical protein
VIDDSIQSWRKKYFIKMNNFICTCEKFGMSNIHPQKGKKIIRQLFSNAVIKNEYTGCIIDIFEKCIMDKY